MMEGLKSKSSTTAARTFTITWFKEKFYQGVWTMNRVYECMLLIVCSLTKNNIERTSVIVLYRGLHVVKL